MGQVRRLMSVLALLAQEKTGAQPRRLSQAEVRESRGSGNAGARHLPPILTDAELRGDSTHRSTNSLNRRVQLNSTYRESS